MSDAYLWAGYNEGFLTATAAREKAKLTAEKAVALDRRSAEAHTSLAVFKLFYEFDWPGCEREFRQAIALNPNYSFAHDQFGMALGFRDGSKRRSPRAPGRLNWIRSLLRSWSTRRSRSSSGATPQRPRDWHERRPSSTRRISSPS